jgi:hypothetical protein
MLCAQRAGKDRSCEVYMGVDVFGRGTFSGGGYNTTHAIEIALRAGVSSAVFAPGWVYESSASHFENGGDKFTNRSERFWSSIRTVCVSECMRDSRISSLPLVLTFNQGHGKSFYVRGQAVKSRGSWHDLSFQSLKAHGADLFEAKGNPGLIKSSLSSIACFDGGHGLRIAGVTSTSGKALRIPLLQTNVNMMMHTSSSPALAFSITFKAYKRSDISVELRFGDGGCAILRPMGNRKVKLLDDETKSSIIASKRSGRVYLLPVREILHGDRVESDVGEDDDNVAQDLAAVARKLRSGGMSPKKIRHVLRVESENREGRHMMKAVWITRVYVYIYFFL